jgi:hypothetical protein
MNILNSIFLVCFQNHGGNYLNGNCHGGNSVKKVDLSFFGGN